MNNAIISIEKPKLLSIAEAAKLIDGLSAYGLEQLCKKGEMPHIRFGNKKLIDETVLYETIYELSRRIPNA